MCAEMDEKGVSEIMPKMNEGRVYALMQFTVSAATIGYRAVKGNMMIRFTRHTLIDEVVDCPAEFPKFIYDPVAFTNLPSSETSRAS